MTATAAAPTFTRATTAAMLALAVTAAVPWQACARPAAVTAPASAPAPATNGDAAAARAADWPGYSRTGAQQGFSPLHDIAAGNVGRLGLAWSMDLPAGNTATEPVAVDGVLYFASGLSVVRAVDAASGREMWQHDPQVGGTGSANLRAAWGVRGIAWGHGHIYVGTADGRLIALDARSGAVAWTVQTFDKDQPATISGAPRVIGNRVIIGFGSTTGAIRGHVTAYDARTGAQLWRFWTVPGNPAEGFENPAMAMAAKTWSGEWWKFGGGGAAWNAIAWDAETDTVYIGTGSPYPWNHEVRSAGNGDNLFTASIVALDGRTGAYRWHYQTTPADTWDHDATMDITLADLIIDGQRRRVLMQAPKNGFFYVLDRDTGKPVSAEPYARVTWASRIDPATWRPVEVPGARFTLDRPARIAPSSLGAHNWMPMAFSPATGLVYIPAIDFEAEYTRLPGPWAPPSDRSYSGGQLIMGGPGAGMRKATGSLLAWDPVRQRPAWRVQRPTFLNGGVLATAGNLVFQGTVDGMFSAYAADTGALLWQFDAKAPILAPPISYQAGGRQYVSILTGIGMGIVAWAAPMTGPDIERYMIDPRSQQRRLLTFALDGRGTLPPAPAAPPPPDDPGYTADAAKAQQGMIAFETNCSICHGSMAIALTNGPDLRRSAMPADAAAFAAVVRGGALEAAGMPRFPEFDEARLEAVRQYLRSRADDLRHHRRTPASTTDGPASLGM